MPLSLAIICASFQHAEEPSLLARVPRHLGAHLARQLARRGGAANLSDGDPEVLPNVAPPP